jgi:hypothetical protein
LDIDSHGAVIMLRTADEGKIRLRALPAAARISFILGLNSADTHIIKGGRVVDLRATLPPLGLSAVCAEGLSMNSADRVSLILGLNSVDSPHSGGLAAALQDTLSRWDYRQFGMKS